MNMNRYPPSSAAHTCIRLGQNINKKGVPPGIKTNHNVIIVFWFWFHDVFFVFDIIKSTCSSFLSGPKSSQLL